VGGPHPQIGGGRRSDHRRALALQKKRASNRSTGGWLASSMLRPIPAGLNCRISMREKRAKHFAWPFAHPGPALSG